MWGATEETSKKFMTSEDVTLLHCCTDLSRDGLGS